MNIEECRSYLNDEVSDALSDEEVSSLQNNLQTFSEVFVEHALAQQDLNT